MNGARFLSYAGNAAKDVFIDGAVPKVVGDRLMIKVGGDSWPCHPLGAVYPGAKVAVEGLDRALARFATRITFGGGALNSLRAAHLAMPGVPVRYVDSSFPDPDLVRSLAGFPVQMRFLESREVPLNFVFALDGDKLIAKEPLIPVGELTSRQSDDLEWLLESDSVLANSVKDIPVARSLSQASRNRGVRLYFVATKSLPLAFLLDEALPAARVIVAAADELAEMAGFAIPETTAECLTLTRWLQAQSPKSVVFLTMGRHGALVSNSARGDAYHVSLSPAKAVAVSSWIERSRANANGCGDAFAGGAYAALELGGSDGLGLHSAVHAALFGCITAIRWLAYPGALGRDDFEIVKLNPTTTCGLQLCVPA
jgi:sugar/nucleoside kinase (ribokinase family)